MRRVVIAGASLVGLMVAVRLREVGYDVAVLDRGTVRTGRTADPGVPPLPVDGPNAAAFRAWADRSSMYPRPEETAGADGATLEVDAWWLAVLAEAGASAVDVRSGHRVVGVATAEGRVSAVRTDQGPLTADLLIVAAGADAIGITPALGVQLPVVPEAAAWCRGRGDGIGTDVRHVVPPDEGASVVHAAIAVRDARRTTWYGAYRSFGAAGARREQLARDYLSRLAAADGGPASTCDGALVWQRHPHCTADHRPVVGPLPSVPTVVLALPHGPFGNAAAVPIVEAAVRAATGALPFPDDAAWSPDRFPQGASGGRMKAVA